MTTTRRYVGGVGHTDASPRPLTATSFRDFVISWLNAPVTCALTRAAYHALPPVKQKAAKSTSYFCAAVFGGDGTRKVVNVTSLSLLVLDVDDPAAARQLLDTPLDDVLPFNHVLWTTLTSTEEAPRVRLVVDTEPLTPALYRAGVLWLAARLGIVKYDAVSLDPAHLWYRPTVFADETGTTPLVAYRVTGPSVSPRDWEGFDPDAAVPSAEDTADLEHLPATDVTLEDAAAMLDHVDPDVDYRQWTKVLCGLKHQFGPEAFDLFDQWSAKGAKYPGREATLRKWNAFTGSTNPVTIRSLIEVARAAGWSTTGGAAERIEKMIDDATQVRELTGGVIQEIHKATTLSALDRDALLGRLHVRSKALGAPVGLKSFRKALEALDERPEGAAVPSEMQGYVFVRELNLWVHPHKGTQVPTSAFDTGFAHLLPPDAGTPSRHALHALGLAVVDRQGYEPRRPGDLIYVTENDVRVLNTYRASYPEADPQRSAAAARIMTDHLTLMFPDPVKRGILLDWFSWVLRNPGEKVRWHVFVQGAQGCGKSLVCEAFRVCVGPTNGRKVSPAMLMEKFNLWASNILFAYFEEVLVGERQKDTMETVKDLVTGATVNIRAMRSDAVEMPNLLNGVFLSNHHHGLRLSRDDRRFFCLCAAQQTKAESEAIPRSHFAQVHRLQTELAGGLRHWLLTRPIDDSFDPFGHAPVTADRDIVLRAGASEIDAEVTGALEDPERWQFGADVVSGNELCDTVRGVLRGATPKQVYRVLTEMGYAKYGQRLCGDGVRRTLWFRADRLPEGLTPLEVFNAKISANDA